MHFIALRTAIQLLYLKDMTGKAQSSRFKYLFEGMPSNSMCVICVAIPSAVFFCIVCWRDCDFLAKADTD